MEYNNSVHHVRMGMGCSTTSVVLDMIACMFHLSQYWKFSLHISNLHTPWLNLIGYDATTEKMLLFLRLYC